MIKPVSRYELARIKRRLVNLYGHDHSERLVERLYHLIGRYGVGLQPEPMLSRWSEKDTVLITYADSITSEENQPLRVLKKFADKHFKKVFSAIHLLPFYPWSSDDGFSVIDYRQVDPSLGKWADIEKLGEHFELMFDLVLNHCSAHSSWFQDFIDGIQPARDYFIQIDPETDLSAVVRPRTSPLLTQYKTRDGEAHVWTTFSADQIDLNWKNPDLLFEFLDILFWYLSKRARLIRLDAVAFVWKKLGSSCIHLPEAHEIVRLFREILDIVAPRSLIITETNVPQAENFSYFGDGNEAHMVYQFTLPPLLLHGLMFGNAEHLTLWAKNLPKLPNGCNFFNFAASHDGIGVRPVEGILPESERDRMISRVEQCGGKVSSRVQSDGSTTPYEMNITFYSALAHENPQLWIECFLCAQSVLLCLKGIPGIYIHSLFGTPNDTAYMEQTGHLRSINRKKWNDEELLKETVDKKSSVNRIFRRMLEMIRIRGMQPAFHPDSSQFIHDVGPSVFAVERQSIDLSQRILCVHNFADTSQTLPNLANSGSEFGFQNHPYDLLSGQMVGKKGKNFLLKPFQMLWLTES